MTPKDLKQFLWSRKKYFLVFFILLTIGFPGTRLGVEAFKKSYEFELPSQNDNCLPWSFYLFVKKPGNALYRGGLLVFLAQHMGHGFDGRKVMKLIAGMPGDEIRIANGRLYINGIYWDDLWLCSELSTERISFDRVEIVPGGKFFVLGTNKRSYDSRYWGFVDESQVLGHGIPLL